MLSRNHRPNLHNITIMPTQIFEVKIVTVEWLLQKQEAIISSKATPPLKAKEAAKALTSCALTWETV